MAKNSMTIEQVKERRIKLEKDLFDLLKDFEKDTGLPVSYLNIERRRSDEDRRIPTIEADLDDGVLADVRVNLNFGF